ncbi:MAG: right-handed parallel beta-helix repeat-containing protein [Planctomycetota bacterium]
MVALTVAAAMLPRGEAQTVVTPGDDLGAIARNAQAGDVIELGAGTFTLNDELMFSNNGVTLRGQADGSSRLVLGNGFSTTSAAAVIDLEGRSNITLEHLTIDGQNRADGATYGVYARNGSGHVVQNLDIQRLANDGSFGAVGVYFNGGVDDSSILGNTVTDIGVNDNFGSGIRVHGDSDRNLIADNTVDRTGRGGIFALGNPDNELGTSSLDGLIIQNNIVTNSALAGGPDLGIEVQNDIRDVVIQHNVVDRRISLDEVRGAAVRCNIVTQADNDPATTQTGDYGLELVDVFDVVASANQVLGDVDLGVSFSGNNDTRHVALWHNVVRAATTFGVQIQGRDNADADGTAKRILLQENLVAGTLGGDAAISSNTGDGVRFNMAFDAITLDQNFIASNGGQDLFLNDAPADSVVTLSRNRTDGEATDPGGNLESLAVPLTQETVVAELGESVTVVFDDLANSTVERVLWDAGLGFIQATTTATLLIDAAEFGLEPGTLTNGSLIYVVAWDASGRVDTAWVEVSMPTPTSGAIAAAMLGGLTLRPNRRSAPAPSNP